MIEIYSYGLQSKNRFSKTQKKLKLHYAAISIIHKIKNLINNINIKYQKRKNHN